MTIDTARAQNSQVVPHDVDFRASNAYRYYAVWLLCGVYMLNMLDRQLLSILIEPIRTEFALSDTHMGFLGGLAFALFYTTLGMPLARLADRSHRVNIIAVSIAVWSAFTALTGLAKGFWHLLAARVGVGIGEAGCNPAAYSLISDYFEPRRRATALSIYQMGGYAGGFVGLMLGGAIAQEYGWRVAFYVVGLPGIVRYGRSDRFAICPSPPLSTISRSTGRAISIRRS
jgi:MFS family permease